MDRRPKSGEFYRHFKDKLYQVITVAYHSETGEEWVVYQALYGDYRTYIRPLEMFVSEVDHEKYPEVTQQYRFEKVILSAEAVIPETVIPETIIPESGDAPVTEPVTGGNPLHPLLLSFIEAEDYDGQLECLAKMRGKIGQEELDIIYVALDMKAVSGDVNEQIYGIEQYLKMQKQYEGGRLR